MTDCNMCHHKVLNFKTRSCEFKASAPRQVILLTSRERVIKEKYLYEANNANFISSCTSNIFDVEGCS